MDEVSESAEIVSERCALLLEAALEVSLVVAGEIAEGALVVAVLQLPCERRLDFVLAVWVELDVIAKEHEKLLGKVQQFLVGLKSSGTDWMAARVFLAEQLGPVLQ